MLENTTEVTDEEVVENEVMPEDDAVVADDDAEAADDDAAA